MKIDKRNPKHWIALIKSAVVILLSLLIRPFCKKKYVILYGHKLNGNLKSLSDYLNKNTDIKHSFLTLDKNYFQQIKSLKPDPILCTKLSTAFKLAQTKVIVSDHGLHALTILQKTSKIKFVDVWHGIPFVHQEFHLQKDYTQIWCPSKSMAQIYKEQGFKNKQIVITGYGRTDALINKQYDKHKLLEKYNIQKSYKKIILFAPTWQHSSKSRNILGFKIKPEEFFAKLNELMKKNKSLLIFRTHLNSKNEYDINCSNIRFMPFSQYPQAEEFLFLSDILIADWSSIVFDYLVLKRPTLFLDIKLPSSKGFAYGPENRYGEIVKSFEELTANLEDYIKTPNKFQESYKSKMNTVHNHIYDSHADGKSTERYFKELKKLLI